MQVQKWIIVEETAMIVPLSQAIKDSNSTGTGICWLPGSPEDLRLPGNSELFHQVLSPVRAAIALKLSAFAEMQDAGQALDSFHAVDTGPSEFENFHGANIESHFHSAHPC